MSETNGSRNFFARPEVQLVAAVMTLAGGGVGSHTLMSSKLDTHGEKLDGVRSTLTEVKVQVVAFEKTTAELAAQHTALMSRVVSLETRDAAHTEQLIELQRRIRDIETRTTNK